MRAQTNAAGAVRLHEQRLPCRLRGTEDKENFPTAQRHLSSLSPVVSPVVSPRATAETQTAKQLTTTVAKNRSGDTRRQIARHTSSGAAWSSATASTAAVIGGTRPTRW